MLYYLTSATIDNTGIALEFLPCPTCEGLVWQFSWAGYRFPDDPEAGCVVDYYTCAACDALVSVDRHTALREDATDANSWIAVLD